ncbi:hypothetical protein U1Q18_037206 [Sarracenia purpurea var. burkii]
MGICDLDGFDCIYDLEGQSKKRRLDIYGSQTLKRSLEDDKWLGNGMVDLDYKAFLNNLVEYSEQKHSVGVVSGGGEAGHEEDDVDPQYMMFLEKLKEDGKSYELEVMTDNKTSLSVKYEDEDDLDHDHEPLTRCRKIQDAEKMEAKEDLRNLPSKDKLKTQKNLRNVGSKDTIVSRKKMGNPIGKERGNLVVEKDLKTESANHDSGETDGHTCQKHCPEGNHLCNVELDYQIVADVDFEFQMFLKNFKEVGDCMCYSNDGNWIVYEGDDGTSRLFDSLDEEEHQHLGNPDAGKSSKFKEKLMSKLREPYDHEEYGKLWQIINEWRPMNGRHRDLRGPAALKSYLKDELSPSYLERHGCLKRKIDAVKFDPCKVLNLLRGFFFWLENLVYEDAFRPWLDSSCLATMPRNHLKDCLCIAI